MPVRYPKIGNKVIAKIVKTKGDCTIGMKPGEEYELSVQRCGEFCGYFYHNIFNWISTLQFDGTFPVFPEPDVQVWECPNSLNRVRVELRRVKE